MKKCLYLFSILSICILLFGCNHIHTYTKEVIIATCSSEGYTKYSCSCGMEFFDDFTEKLEHSYGEWEVVLDATSEKTGLKVQNCLECGFENSEIIPVKQEPHVHKYTETQVEPKCLEQGYTLFECICGNSYKDNYVDELGHDFGDWYEINTSCNIKDSMRECKVCGDKESKREEGEFHSYYTHKENPTCDNDGYIINICIKCEHKEIIEYIEKLGHDFGDWEIIENPTYETTGSKVKICSLCLTEVVEIIPKLEPLKTFTITYDLNGGVFEGGYETIEKVAEAFLNDYNQAANTNATINNFLKDSTSSVKDALSKESMLTKWNWLFKYMYQDLVEYNTNQKTMNVSYVADGLELLMKMIDGDTTVIKDSSKGPNFRTLVRSYLHGMMNQSKGDQTNNPTFALYVPDFSNEANCANLLSSQFNLEYEVEENSLLLVPTKKYYKFIGWENEKGEITNKALSNGKLTAIWEELTPVTDIVITNKITEVTLFDSYQLEWQITPSDAVNKEVKFISSDTSIADVDEYGLITTYKSGSVQITIISLALSQKSDSMNLDIITPGYFDIRYETNSYVSINETITLFAEYITPKNERVNVSWKSLNEDIATVDDSGNVTGLKEGLATIRVLAPNNPNEYEDFIVTVVGQNLSDALKVLLEAHESNVYVEYNLPIGAGTPAYYADIIGSVSRILFNDKLVIDTTYNEATNAKYGEALKDRVMESIEFITVHYTGSMASGANAEAHAKYFALPLSQNKTAIHYSTGNDGVYLGMDEIYRAAHAGDDGSEVTVAKFEWLDTPVEVLPGDPLFAEVSISKNSTFTINGRDTFIKIPVETKFGRGYVTEDKWLNKMDLAVNVKDGKYQLGTSWWCYTQVWEGRICSNGGNRNSIGIESCVNQGSDLWYTWQKTAQLVADIMLRHNLDITKVKGHHFFSAKNCPQPFLENDLRLWNEFIKLVQAEYAKLVSAHDIEYTFSSNSEYLDNKGRVLKNDEKSKVVTYTVTLSNGESITLASIIEGKLNK